MVQSVDVGTPAKDDTSTAEATTATKNVDEGAVKAPDNKNVDEGGVEPGSVQTIRIRISRKGQRAILACILSIVVAVGVGIFIGFRIAHGSNNSPLKELLGDICGTTL